jgi:hypothetical protein
MSSKPISGAVVYFAQDGEGGPISPTMADSSSTLDPKNYDHIEPAEIAVTFLAETLALLRGRVSLRMTWRMTKVEAAGE